MILTNIVGTLVTLQTIHKIGNYYAPLTLKNQSYFTTSNNNLREGVTASIMPPVVQPSNSKGKHYFLVSTLILLRFC